jgi:hypothetical protein
VEFGEGYSEIGPSCKRGSESAWGKRFDINWVWFRGGVPLGLRLSNVLMGCRDTHRGEGVVNMGIVPLEDHRDPLPSPPDRLAAVPQPPSSLK